MVAEYKIRGLLGNLNPFFAFFFALKDAELGLPMLQRGKLHFKLGAPVKNKALVRRIFAKCQEPVSQ
jgi:hypothetical protein